MTPAYEVVLAPTRLAGDDHRFHRSSDAPLDRPHRCALLTDAWKWKRRRSRPGRNVAGARRGDHVRVLFDCDHVSFRRGGAVVLEQLTFGISEGTTCVAGPSGAGKSTLLRLFNRLSDPAGGVVRYRGRDVRDYDVLALRREVGLVPQLPALLDGTVEMNVSFGARLAGEAADVYTALRLAGLDETFAGRPAGRLSVGEQQRVMRARALALSPRCCCSTSRPPPWTSAPRPQSSGPCATCASVCRCPSSSSPTN